MTQPTAKNSEGSDFSWLIDVHEVRQPLSRIRPIWVRESVLRDGPPGPRPTVPYPERHPFCELGIGLEGAGGVQYIGRERLSMPMHSVMLLGPGIPHYAELIKYPSRAVTIYFLPILLFDSGPQDDSARVLNRFTADKAITERIVTPPPEIWKVIKRNAVQMLREFREDDFGSQFRLRSLLLETLVCLMRWEKAGHKSGKFHDSVNWEYIQKGLNYIQEHFSEPLYIEEIARFVGISDSRLKTIFRESLGMSCVQYIKTYRISLAAAEMCASNRSITDIAFSVGYETLSNFNTAFHKLMGMSPTKYISSMKKTTHAVRQAAKNRDGEPEAS